MNRKKKLHVALITPSFPTNKNSISGVFVERLASHIAKHVKLEVYTPADNEDSKYTHHELYSLHTFHYAPTTWQTITHIPGGIPVAFKKNRLLIIIIPFFLASLIWTIFRAGIKADILHANWSSLGAISGLIGLITRTPVITTIRGSDVSGLECSWIKRIILKLCLRTNNILITVSPALKAEIEKLYPLSRNKIKTISNGVDKVFLDIDKTFTHDRPTRIIVVGSLIPRKSIETVLCAIANLINSLELELTIIGDGLEREKLLNLTRTLRLSECVKFTGNLPAEVVLEYLSMADIFVLASKSEGRPNVLLEALAAGVPVIASKIPGVTDIIKNGESGFLFKQGDPKALSSAINQLVSNKALFEKFSMAGRKYIHDNNIDWESSAKKYVYEYHEIIRAHK